MSDSSPSVPPPPPFVTVTLPGGTQVRGELHHREQQPGGAWTYTVAIPVPAAACAPIPGQDYQNVPTTYAGAGEWLLQRMPGGAPDNPRMVLHEATCFTAWAGTRVSRADAQAALLMGDTACDVCEPKP